MDAKQPKGKEGFRFRSRQCQCADSFDSFSRKERVGGEGRRSCISLCKRNPMGKRHSHSQSLSGRPKHGRSSSSSKSIQISSPLAPTLLSSSLARRKVSPPAVSKVSSELQHFWVLLAQIGAGRSAGPYSDQMTIVHAALSTFSA